MTSIRAGGARRAGVELEILYKISQAMLHQHDIPALLNEVLDIMETEMGLSRGTLALRRPDSDVFEVVASRGPTGEGGVDVKFKLGQGVAGKVAKTKKPAIVPDITKDPDLNKLKKERNGDKLAFLCVPVIHQRRVIGTISIDRPAAPETELRQDLNFLKLVSDIVAEAVSEIREQMEERESLSAENRRLRQELGDAYHPSNIVGNCGSMKDVYAQIAQVANSTAIVLIRGESGTGKELVARAIHYTGPRKNNRFVCVNCAALPENLIESELFGHEKGAFTGAMQRRKGRFEQANGGTLFLDEIGDISQSVQVRLLRVLQEQEFERVGGEETIRVNVRIITATSRNLESAMRENRFREDLFYRLNVFPIHIPPLRERRSDVMLLADFFVQKYNKAYGKKIKRISTAAINMMMAYHWPGNVRELENCIERAVLTTTDHVIHGYTLPPSLQTSDQTGTALIPAGGAPLKDMLDSYEKELIIDALKKHKGRVAPAARELGTTQRVLGYAIKRLSIEPKDYR